MIDFDDIDEKMPEPVAGKQTLDGDWDCRVDYFRNGGLVEIVMRINGSDGEYHVVGGSQTHRLRDIARREERYAVKVDFRWVNCRGQKGSGVWTLRASGNVLDGTWNQDGVDAGPWKWTGVRMDAEGVAPALPEADKGPPLPCIDGQWDCLCDAYKLGDMVTFCMTIQGSGGHFEMDGIKYLLSDINCAWDGAFVAVTFRWEICGSFQKARGGAGTWQFNTTTERLNGNWTQDGLSSGPWMWNCTKKKVAPPPPEPPPPPQLRDTDAVETVEAAAEPCPQASVPEPVELSITREQAVALQAELLAAYGSEDVRRKLEELRAGSASSRKLAEARATLCVQAQRRILPKYGFDTSRKGLIQSAVELEALAAVDSEAASNNELLRWLQSSEPQGESGDGAPAPCPQRSEKYRIQVTEPSDEAGVKGVERLRGSLACAHQDLYRSIYPGLQQHEWLNAIGRDNMVEYLKTEGIVVMHAEAVDTGEVVGYVSCQVAGEGDDDGASSSSSDTPRPDTVAVDFASLGELDAGGRLSREAEDGERGFGEFSGPNATIGHIAVLEEHRGRGIGRMLFEGLVAHLREAFPTASSDLRINVVELNRRAVEWYRRLGFLPVDLWVRRFSIKSSLVPVVFLTMQRREDGPCVPWKNFFNADAKGAKVIVFPEDSPEDFLREVARQPWPKLTPASVGVYDVSDGMHELSDGRSVELTEAFVQGRALFERPLHNIVSA